MSRYVVFNLLRRVQFLSMLTLINGIYLLFEK